MVPDAVTFDDLAIIARGYLNARNAGVRVVVRCAPPFVGALTGATADEFVAFPSWCGPVLIVCGSYVPGATRQLAQLFALTPDCTIEVSVTALARPATAANEIQRVSEATQRMLADRNIAVVMTTREHRAELSSPESSEQISTNLGRAVAEAIDLAGVVVSKGGTTSYALLRHAFGVREAEVLGPVAPGIARWRISGRKRKYDYLVVPGNVGSDSLLVDVVRALLS
jgi:uncharacterized protein YgbK (DUF1537 family)